MSAERSAARLVALYPRRWRARYGDELQALILDMSDGRRVPWRVRADVAGAGGRECLRALRPGQGDPAPSAGDRARGGASLVLWAWAMFVVAGAIVAKTAEHWQAAMPAGGHATASIAFDALMELAGATALVVAGAIALTLPTAWRSVRAGGWRRVRRVVTVAAALTVAFVAATAALVIWAHGLTARQRDGQYAAYAIGVVAWAALGAATLAAWTAAATRIAARLPTRPARLRLQVRMAGAVAGALAAMAVATAVWWAAVSTRSPAALVGMPGGGRSALVPQLMVAMALMLCAVALGGAGARRALRALPALEDRR
jgi:hypothetical protein